MLCVLAVLSSAQLRAEPESDFSLAKEAFVSGNAARLATLSARLVGTPLEPYAAYWQLKMRLDEAAPQTVTAFLDRYEGSLLAERMRRDWLKILAKRQAWSLFLGQYPKLGGTSTELACDWLQARIQTGDAAAAHEAYPIWKNEKIFPDSCMPLIEGLISSNEIGVDEIWAKLRFELAAGNVSFAKRINRYLPSRDMLDERQLDVAYSAPHRLVEPEAAKFATRAEREIEIYAISRIARSSPPLAYSYWMRFSSELPSPDRQYLIGQIAMQAALNHQPESLQWFKEAGDSLSDQQLEWKAREALRLQNWAEVLGSIQAMSQSNQNIDCWRYWKARALRAQGRTVEANSLFAALSHVHQFYGQLALEELGTVVTIPPESYKASDAEVAAVENLPGIRRALLLYSMNLRFDANSEWEWTIRSMDDKQLLAAAELARRHRLYDRAINTAEKTVQLHDFSLRFLAPYREIMQQEARQQDLDEAWVYGLIRQESRFITTARSNVGASGLMQLMPATAKWVARKLGLRDFRQSLTGQLALNVSLGTYYLKHVLTLLDNQPVLASAAYNAGPVRARQWVDTKPMEGAIYAETIPFSETRNYVKKVMSNTEYYASSFGQEIRSLKDRLGVIGGAGGNQPGFAPDEP